MAEVFVEFENTWQGPDGKSYEARACGREREDGLWEATSRPTFNAPAQKPTQD